MTNSNPSLAELLREAMEARIADLHVSLPGIIQKYDAATQTADIQPALQKKYASGRLVNLPLLVNVPVLFPRSADAWLHIPLKKGDSVLLVFVERAIDNFILSGGVQDPADFRKHSLSDAVAIPGFFSRKQPIPGKAGQAELVNGKAAIRLLEDGRTLLGNNDTTEASEPVPLGLVLQKYLEDVHTQIDKILDILITGAHVVVTSPGNPTGPEPVSAAKFTQIKAALNALKGSPISNKLFLSDVLFTEKGE